MFYTNLHDNNLSNSGYSSTESQNKQKPLVFLHKEFNNFFRSLMCNGKCSYFTHVTLFLRRSSMINLSTIFQEVISVPEFSNRGNTKFKYDEIQLSFVIRNCMHNLRYTSKHQQDRFQLNSAAYEEAM